MTYKFTTFVDALEFGLDAWYASHFNEERNRRKVDPETMAKFIRDVDGWANMFFCTDSQQAMDDINYETLEVAGDKNEN
jgi:hypothetical protein